MKFCLLTYPDPDTTYEKTGSGPTPEKNADPDPALDKILTNFL
jgi:hypothetical protein